MTVHAWWRRSIDRSNQRKRIERMGKRRASRWDVDRYYCLRIFEKSVDRQFSSLLLVLVCCWFLVSRCCSDCPWKAGSWSPAGGHAHTLYTHIYIPIHPSFGVFVWRKQSNQPTNHGQWWSPRRNKGTVMASSVVPVLGETVTTIMVRSSFTHTLTHTHTTMGNS